MDIEALRTFVEVERAGGVTRAAAALYRSQPAISRRIALLERELGAPVFERVSGGMIVTDVGRALLPFAERALATLRDAEAAVAEVRSSGGGQLAIALVGTLASSGLTPVLRRFASAHPHVELTLRTATSHEVSDLVRRADVSLGLRYSEDPHPELESETLFREPMAVVAAPDHPRAGRRVPHLADLAGERWMAFPNVPGRPEASARLVGGTLEAAGVDADAILRIDSLTAQKRLVEAGFGLALLPTSSLGEERASGSLAVLTVGDLDVSLPVAVVTRRDGYLGAAARALLEELRGFGGGGAGGG